MCRQCCGCGFQEAFVIGARHEEVDIIIPRDIALMADGAEEGAAGEAVAKVVFLAERVEGIKEINLDGADFRERNGFEGFFERRIHAGR